ncbi:MAG: aminoacyl-tRNA hydrolase [Pirellulaceae bacterium]
MGSGKSDGSGQSLPSPGNSPAASAAIRGEAWGIVGLGNPGSKYQETRHNIGFAVVDRLSKQFGSGSPSSKFDSRWQAVEIQGRRGHLLWPQTFMNCSGRAVGQLVKFFKIPASQILVICDDLDLPLGRIRIRAKGSSGGQKGLADILQVLGTQEVPRLRIGIDPVPSGWDAADYVLSRFNKKEQPEVDLSIQKAVDAAADWVGLGIDTCMNRHNRND